MSRLQSETERTIKVLIVDDSYLWANTLAEVLVEDPGIEVLDTAGDGQQAILRTESLRPDLVIMDIRMPVLGGLEAISRIMADCPTPILAMTGEPGESASSLTFEALRRGALDLMVKDTTYPPPASFARQLCTQVKELAGVHVVRHPTPMSAPGPGDCTEPAEHSEIGVVAMVASTGGPAALARILQGLGEGFPVGMLIVQHLISGFAPIFAGWLNALTPLKVSVAEDGDRVLPGRVLIAPNDRHLLVRIGGRVGVNRNPPYRGNRPSGDLLLSSVAGTYGPKSLGLVLTGMGSDGSEGLRDVRRAGGRALAQDQESSIVFGMPAAAAAADAVEQLVPLDEIPSLLMRLVQPRGGANPNGTGASFPP